MNPRTGALADRGIPVGSAPDALAVNPTAAQLYVANSGSSNVTVINTADNTVSFPSFTVGSDPISLAFDPLDNLVFVANAGNAFLSVINLTHMVVQNPNITLVNGPAAGLAFSRQSDRLLATTPSNLNVTLIDARLQSPLSAILHVGKGMVAVTTSTNGTEFVLGNASGSDVVILNSTDGSQVGTDITVEAHPTELLPDPQSGNVYCWTSSARVLESVNLSSKIGQPATFTTSPELLSVSSSPAQSRVFVSSANSSLIYDLNSTRLDQTSPVIQANAVPLSTVADPANDRLYVGTSTGLDVYNASTDKLNATASALTGNCTQLVLDQPDNLLWLANNLAVDAVSLKTLQVLNPTGLLVPAGSTQGIAFDPSDAEIFVLVSPSTVEVLSSSGENPPGPEINVGANVTSLAYDPSDNQIYAAGDGVTLVNGTSHTVDGGPVLLGGPHKVLGAVYEPSREDIYIASVGLLPGKQGMVSVLDGSSMSASEASEVQIPVGEAPDAFGVVTSGNNAVPGSAMVWVANALSGTVSVISSPPQVTEFAASPSTIDLGFPTSIAVSYLGGAGPSTVTFYGLPPGCTSSDETQLTCTPSSVGVYTLAVNVTDSFGLSANVTAPLTVEGSLSVLLKSTLVTFPDIDVGVPLVVVPTVSGGLSPYSYQWSFGDGSTAAGSTASHSYSHPGVFLLTTQVRDSTGATNESSAVVTVNPSPSVGLGLTPGNVTDVAIPLSLNATITGGTGASQETWTFGDATETVGVNNTSHAWDRPGNYTVTFAYTDALGVAANRSVEVTVHPSLAATFSTGNASASNPPAPGTSVNFTSDISGGTPPYRESWSFGDGSFASGLSVNHSYGSSGTYTVKVTLIDAVGESVETNLSVTVATSSSSGGGLSAVSGGFGSGLFLGLVIGGVAAAAVLFVVGLRKGGRPPAGPPTPYVPP